MEVKNKVVLSLKQFCMLVTWSLVTIWNSYYFEQDSEIVLFMYVCVYNCLLLYHYTINNLYAW